MLLKISLANLPLHCDTLPEPIPSASRQQRQTRTSSTRDQRAPSHKSGVYNWIHRKTVGKGTTFLANATYDLLIAIPPANHTTSAIHASSIKSDIHRGNRKFPASKRKFSTEPGNKSSEGWNQTSEERNQTSEEFFRSSVEDFRFLPRQFRFPRRGEIRG